jgi:hypothetical protein
MLVTIVRHATVAGRIIGNFGFVRPLAGKTYGHFTTGGIEDRIDSTLPPVRRPKMVPRS